MSPGGETTQERVERLISEGKMPLEAVRAAEDLWNERLREGIVIPSGERVLVRQSDLYHLIVDERKLEREGRRGELLWKS